MQVLTSNPAVESWGHFPESKQRLLQLMEETRPAGALFLSGDVHYAEMLGGAAAEPADLLEVRRLDSLNCFIRLPQFFRLWRPTCSGSAGSTRMARFVVSHGSLSCVA